MKMWTEDGPWGNDTGAGGSPEKEGEPKGRIFTILVAKSDWRKKRGGIACLIWPDFSQYHLIFPSGMASAPRVPDEHAMKCAEQTRVEETVESSTQSVIQLPLGLLGFEKVMNYILLGSREEAPFFWLQMLEDPNLSFLVLSSEEAIPEYAPDISDEDMDFLELRDAADALVLNIVTRHGDGRATVNLKGPVVVNRRTLKGKQVIPRNVSSFALQHPLSLDLAA